MTVFVDTGDFSTVSSRSLLGDMITEAHGANVAGASPEQGPFTFKRLMQLEPGRLPRHGGQRQDARAAASPRRREAPAGRPLRALRGAARDATVAGPRSARRSCRSRGSCTPGEGGKLAGWVALVGSLAALNYASRFTSGKPPADSLYR